MAAERSGARSRMLTGGSLERTPLAEVVRMLYRERATAKLLVSYRGEERTFWFDRGQLLSASSNREAQLVGDLLRTFGLAEESLLMTAFEKALAEPGRGLARALTGSGAVPDYVADAAVRALSERLFFESFRWTTGVFTVTPLDAAPDVPVRADRPTGGLLLEALRRLPAPAAQLTSPLSPRARPVFTPDLLLRYQAFTVSAVEAEVLGRIDGVAHGGADPRGPAGRRAARGHGPRLPRRARPHDREVRRPGRPALPERRHRRRGARGPRRRAARRAARARPAHVPAPRLGQLSTRSSASSATLRPRPSREALHERARLFHPDLCLKSHLGDDRDALEALFSRVREAERIFRTPESRAQYDRSLEVRADTVSLPGSAPTVEIQKEIARKNYTRAKGLYDEEDYYPAYEMVRQAVEFDPDQKEYWVLLSRIQRKNPKWIRQATETMRRAVKKLPDSVDLWWELAEAYAHERNQPERVKALKEVMRLDPVNRRAQQALSEINGKSG